MNTQAERAAEAESRHEATREGPVYRPAVDIREGEDELTLLADVPGAAADGIDLRFENGLLEIRARIAPKERENVRWLVREYGEGDYYRAFQVSEEIDANRITAEVRDGVLSLRLPKSEARKPRRIPVQAP